MPKKPRIPDPLTIIYCIACHKPTNGRGWYGPGCQCEAEFRQAVHATHSIARRRGRTNWS